MKATSTSRIQRMTSKGQITLPVSWRKLVKTDHVSVRAVKEGMLISPAYIIEEEKGWTSIFNAKRDNGGKGIPATEFARILRRLIKEDEKVSKTDRKATRKK